LLFSRHGAPEAVGAATASQKAEELERVSSFPPHDSVQSRGRTLAYRFSREFSRCRCVLERDSVFLWEKLDRFRDATLLLRFTCRC
jgi:hypothetical protein